MNRRGMTFLEVVAAVALLAILASTVFGAFDFMMGRQRIEQQTLGAHEVANRLILSFLDDNSTMPDSSLPIEYGPDRYRWDIRVDQVQLHPAEPAIPDTSPPPAAGRDRPNYNDRIRQVTVRVWLGEESGGTYGADPGVPHARITRLLYALAMRNPDSFDNMIHSDKGIRGYMDDILGTGTDTTSGSGTTGTRRPATTPSSSRRAPVSPTGGRQ